MKVLKAFLVVIAYVVLIVLIVFCIDPFRYGPNSSEYRRIVDEAEMKANITHLVWAIEKHNQKTGTYPLSIGDLVQQEDIKNVFSEEHIQHIKTFCSKVSKGNVTYIPIKQDGKCMGYRLLVYHTDLDNLSRKAWTYWLEGQKDSSILSYYPQH